MGQKGGSSNQAAVRARLLNVHAHPSVLPNIPQYALHIKSCGCCFFHAVGCADIGGGPSNAPRIPGPEGRICTPPGAASPAQRRHRKNGLNSAQVSGRPVDRVVKVVCGPGEDLQDAVEGCFRLLPSQAMAKAQSARKMGSAMFASEVTL